MITLSQSLDIRILAEQMRDAAVLADKTNREYQRLLAQFTDLVRGMETEDKPGVGNGEVE